MRSAEAKAAEAAGRIRTPAVAAPGQPALVEAAPPWYPMQSMIAVFDFPDRSLGDDNHVPRLVIDRLRGWAT